MLKYMGDPDNTGELEDLGLGLLTRKVKVARVAAIPSGETILYVFARVSETFMGVFVAILVNYDIDRIRLFFEKKEK